MSNFVRMNIVIHTAIFTATIKYKNLNFLNYLYPPQYDSFILFYYKYCKDFYDKCLISEQTNHFSKCPQGQTCLKNIVMDDITFLIRKKRIRI